MGNFSLQGAADISAAHDRGTKMLLKTATGEPILVDVLGEDGKVTETEAWALVAGKLSKTYREAEALMRDKQFKRASQRPTFEAVNAQQLEITASCVLDWNMQDGTKPIPCTKSNVMTVLTVAQWLREDIEAVINDPSRFLG